MSLISETTGSIRMRGYVSDLSSPDEEWPATYVIVQTSPDGWMATLPLDELMLVVDKRRAADLRGIPHRWDAGQLIVELGPVHLRGGPDEWRSLGRRLLDVAGSARELHEAPGTRPWDGPAETISVNDLQLHEGSRELVADWDARTPDSQLAAAGGFSKEQFVELFGCGWQPIDVREQVSLFEGETFLWGQPPQLAAVVAPGSLRIGLPGGGWHGPAGFEREVVDAVGVDARMPEEMIEAFVRDLLRRRRRSFTWCRYCGDQLTPEMRHDRDLCYGCASAVLGVVY